MQPEHVHCIIETQVPEHTSKLLNYLKEYPSYQIFKKHPLMRLRYRKGHLWSRGSFSRTVRADLNIVYDYVRHQEDIHQRTLTNYQKCNKCQLLPVCAGGCANAVYMKFKTYHGYDCFDRKKKFIKERLKIYIKNKLYKNP